MITILIIFLMIVCIVMAIAVLLQSSKGSGLVGPIAGTGVTTMFGARRTSDFLSKATIIMAIVFLAGSLLLNLYISKGGKGVNESIIQKNAGSQTYPNPNVPPQQQQQPPAGDQNNPGNQNQNTP
ncbi:MAG: preprotein translocase subunit SecG [Ignavibacteria bacterium]